MSTALQTTTETPAVTLVTALAETGDLSDAAYRAIYNRLAAEKGSLRAIRQALGGDATLSIAWWARYAAGDVALSRTRRNELRAWAGLPLLPPTVTEAVAGLAHPDAAVYRVGGEVASRVVLVGADVPEVTLYLNGSLAVADVRTDALVRGGTASSGAAAAVTGHSIRPGRVRLKYVRPCLSVEPRLRIAQLRRLLAEAEAEAAQSEAAQLAAG